MEQRESILYSHFRGSLQKSQCFSAFLHVKIQLKKIKRLEKDYSTVEKSYK